VPTSPYQEADDPVHDLGPWIEAPQSSRLSRYRYDYGSRELQVTWKNGRGHVHTVYGAADTEVYRRFARAVSKGKFVNRVLNGLPYMPASPDQVDAPSNPNRRAVQSRP
jgi:hypothetical protein